jgi:hypothetical protein
MAASSSPSGEGVPQVMGAAQIQVGQHRPGRLHGGLVDPPQVVGRQRRPSAARDAVAAPRSGEDQVLRSTAVGELAGDGLADLVAHGHHSDAGQAFGFGFEVAAEAARLIADLDDFDAAQLGEDAAAAQPQQLAAA